MTGGHLHARFRLAGIAKPWVWLQAVCGPGAPRGEVEPPTPQPQSLPTTPSPESEAAGSGPSASRLALTNTRSAPVAARGRAALPKPLAVSVFLSFPPLTQPGLSAAASVYAILCVFNAWDQAWFSAERQNLPVGEDGVVWARKRPGGCWEQRILPSGRGGAERQEQSPWHV